MGQTIDSALSQSFTDREIVVVDDGSTDNTLEILANYGSQIRVIPQSNQGPEAARNRAAEEARGEYLVFLDHDDVLLPFALNIYDEVARKTLSPPMIVGKMRWFKDDINEVMPKQSNSVMATTYRDFLAKSVSVSISYSVLVIQRVLFEQVGGVRKGSSPADDYDLMLRAGIHGPCVIIQSPVNVGYRTHDGNHHKNLERTIKAITRLVEEQRKGTYYGGRWWDRSAYIGGAAWTFLQEAKKAKRRDLTRELLTDCGVPLVVGAIRKLVLKGLRRGTTQRFELAGVERIALSSGND